jgi:hypothetical protein
MIGWRASSVEVEGGCAALADEAVAAAARAWLRFAGKHGGSTAIAIPGSDGARAD